jgi:phosphotransferase system enzyme I (PtsI)
MRRPEDSHPLRLVGKALSPGVAVGTAYQAELFSPSFYRIRVAPEDTPRELGRFRAAVEQSRRQLLAIKQKLETLLGKEHSYIVDVHLLILDDRRWLSEVEERITERLASAERAIRETAEQWLAVFRSLDDPFFRERGSELKDVEERLLAYLAEANGQNNHNHEAPDGFILVAPEISLSLLAAYQIERIKGLVLTNAGATSHVTIIARSYQIPVVAGVEDIAAKIRTGDTVIVDGYEGVVHRNPERADVVKYEARVRRQYDRPSVEDRAPCVTVDDRQVSLFINTEVESEVTTGLRSGAEGVGLFRSEFMLMKKRSGLMNEQEQFEIYKGLVQAAGEKPVILRTLDLGPGRRQRSSEDSTFDKTSLGLRGIRLSFQRPDVFRPQLRAILRASVYGDLRIVFPMISSADEVIQGRRIIDEIRAELEREGARLERPVPIGAMIEVPAAILTLDNILRHADFVAVGTNDLIQYTLAASRSNEQVAYLFNPLHPAVLASLRSVADACAFRERPAFICGEMSAHPLYVYVLVGLGYQRLSMRPSRLDFIKKAVRRMSYREAHETVARMLEIPTIEEMARFVEANLALWEDPALISGVNGVTTHG